MNKFVILLCCAVLAVVGTVAAALNDDQAERALETRQSVLKLMAWNMAPLGAMARDRIEFNGERVEINATRLVALSEMLGDAFKPDTRANTLATEALDVIWEQPDAFAAKLQDNIDASNALVAVAATGDEGDIKQAIGRLGSTCGSCHDDFRLDD